jgi:PEP-CTERM motif
MKLTLLIAAIVLLSSNVLRADSLLYYNYDANHSWQSGTGLSIVTEDAVPFTITATAPQGFQFALSSISFAAAVSNTDTLNTVTARVYDTIGGLPGNVLESFQLILDPQTAGAPEYQVVSGAAPVLQTGQQYWFALSDPVPFDLEWFSDGVYPGQTPPQAQNVATLGGAGWSFNPGQYTQGALQVSGTLLAATTPEPATMLFLGAGLIAIGLLRGRPSSMK